jgi:hypothetical protein
VARLIAVMNLWSCAIGDHLAARISFQRKIRAAPERVDSRLDRIYAPYAMFSSS